MKPKFLLRAACGCLLFFILGHSIGHITRKQTSDPQTAHVLQLMEEHTFPIGNQMRSYDEFYTGMSLNLIASLVAFTLLVWIASELVTTHPDGCRKILIPVLLCTVLYTITGFMYFFIVPAFTCLVASLLLSLALYALRKKPEKVRQLS